MISEEEVQRRRQQSVDCHEQNTFIVLSSVLGIERVAAMKEFQYRVQRRTAAREVLSFGPAGQLTGINNACKFRLERFVVPDCAEDMIPDLLRVLCEIYPSTIWRFVYFTNETIFELVRE